MDVAAWDRKGRTREEKSVLVKRQGTCPSSRFRRLYIRALVDVYGVAEIWMATEGLA